MTKEPECLGALDTMFGAYFHQDWDLDAEDWPGVVDVFVQKEHPRQIAMAIEAIDWVEHSGLSKDQLRELIFKRMGCCCDPELIGIELSDWLKDIKRKLSEG